jgi:hypothetical protein
LLTHFWCVDFFSVSPFVLRGFVITTNVLFHFYKSSVDLSALLKFTPNFEVTNCILIFMEASRVIQVFTTPSPGDHILFPLKVLVLNVDRQGLKSQLVRTNVASDPRKRKQDFGEK